MAKARQYPCWGLVVSVTIHPAMTGPRIVPASIIIWKLERTFPPLRLGPMMSAMAACWAGWIRPAPRPAMNEAARKRGRASERASAAVAAPFVMSPMMMKGRRP